MNKTDLLKSREARIRKALAQNISATGKTQTVSHSLQPPKSVCLADPEQQLLFIEKLYLAKMPEFSDFWDMYTS